MLENGKQTERRTAMSKRIMFLPASQLGVARYAIQGTACETFCKRIQKNKALCVAFVHVQLRDKWTLS